MKRTIALVLALVLVIGMMAVPASADFTDSTDVQYTEAVEVISAAGIIDGFEDGSFDPAGDLTREQAAKVVAYLMLGQKAADALPTTVTGFSDVASSRWSSGYIAYVANEGILAGREDGTFDPTANITGYEFAKLMLGCLGYSAKNEEFVGASWAINVAKIALKIDLFEGNENANYNAPITREEAALYAFNMIQSDLVEYATAGTTVTGGGFTVTTGASKADKVLASGKGFDGKTDGIMQFCEQYIKDLEKTAGTSDDFGRPSTKWAFDGDKVGTYADAAEFTYTEQVSLKEIFDDIDNDDVTTATKYVSGTNNKGTLNLATGTKDDKIGGNGTVIEVYVEDENVTIVIINTYVATITGWTEADKEDDVKESVEVSALTSDNVYDFETTQFTEDDVDDETVVLYTVANGEIKSVVAAESVEAAITKVTEGKSFVAGGETYKLAANVTSEDGIGVDKDTDVVIYVDTYGYAIYVAGSKADATDYAYVAAVEEETGKFGAGDTYYAMLVLADGTQVTAEIESGKDTDKNAYVTELTTLADTIIEYTIDDEVYVIEAAPIALATDAPTVELTKGKTAIGNDYANNSTIYLYVDKDGETDASKYDYDLYTGYKTAPSIEGASVIVAKDTGAAEFVVVLSGSLAGDTNGEFVFVASASASNEIVDADFDINYYTVNAVVDGEIVEIMVTVDPTADVFAESYKTNSDGQFTEFTDVYTAIENGETGLVEIAVPDFAGYEDGVIAGYAVDDDAVAYTVDEDGVIKTATISALKENAKNSATLIVEKDVVIAAFVYVA